MVENISDSRRRLEREKKIAAAKEAEQKKAEIDNQTKQRVSNLVAEYIDSNLNQDVPVEILISIQSIKDIRAVKQVLSSMQITLNEIRDKPNGNNPPNSSTTGVVT